MPILKLPNATVEVSSTGLMAVRAGDVTITRRLSAAEYRQIERLLRGGDTMDLRPIETHVQLPREL